MNILSHDFLDHRGLSKTTYRGTWNRSNVWRLGSLCLGFQPYFVWKRISDRGALLLFLLEIFLRPWGSWRGF